jgi:hypothetical protein
MPNASAKWSVVRTILNERLADIVAMILSIDPSGTSVVFFGSLASRHERCGGRAHVDSCDGNAQADNA